MKKPTDPLYFFGSIHAFLKYILALIFISVIAECHVVAQNDTGKVKLISADILQYNKSTNPDYQILQGNVLYEYQGSLLYCDQSMIYIHRDYIINIGNVHIIMNDTTHMYGDTLKIDGDADLAEMIGNVKMIDNQITLTTDRLYYDLERDIAYYLTGGEITDPKNYLRSERGYYHQKQKEFFFSDSVYIKNKDTEMFSDSLMYNTKTEITHFHGKSKIVQPENTMICEFGTYDTKNDIGKFSKNVELYSGSRILKSDSLYYNKGLGYGEAFRNVDFNDTTENFILTGHYGRFFEADSSFFATDSALMKITDKTDTLYLHADSLFMIQDTVLHQQKVLFAYNKARVYRNDFQAVSDSIVFLTNDSVMYMYQDPIMWMDNTQLIGDTVIVTYVDNKMDKLFLNNNAFIISKEKTSDFQQIKSDNMEGFFTENELDVLWANKNAETIYYIFDEKFRLIGINIAQSENVKIKFENNTVDHIVFHNKPEGTLNPEESLADSQKKLENFRWEQSIRPKYPTDVFRDPLIQPEAPELIVIDTTSFTDTLLQIPADTTIIEQPTDTISSTGRKGQKDNKPKNDNVDTSGGRGKQKSQNSQDQNNNLNEDSDQQGRKKPIVETSETPRFFLKRWIYNWKKKRQLKQQQNTST